MFDKQTDRYLQEALPALPLLACEARLTHDIDDLVAAALPGLSCAVIDDKFTAEAYGDQVFRALETRMNAVHITLPGTPGADEQTVSLLRERTARSGALIAVGSGTVNDLCKYASSLDNKPYLVFPTAASMNGYVSANASITVNGHKKTLSAQMPKAVYCDMAVIANAPLRLSKSGLGDSLARPTAQADWLLSHLLLDTAYNELPFTLLQPLEMELFEQARGIALADPAGIAQLIRLLLLSGFGMAIAGGSYPASQGEHMIAHFMGMLTHHKPPALPHTTLHGEEIAVTTLAMARHQEKILRTRPALRPMDFNETAIAALIGEEPAKEGKAAFAEKQQKIQISHLLEQRLSEWPVVAHAIEKVVIPAEKLHHILEQAQIPFTAASLGWDEGDYTSAVQNAHYLRDRFTFLDLQ